MLVPLEKPTRDVTFAAPDAEKNPMGYYLWVHSALLKSAGVDERKGDEYYKKVKEFYNFLKDYLKLQQSWYQAMFGGSQGEEHPFVKKMLADEAKSVFDSIQRIKKILSVIEREALY